ncbi:MAG: sulfoxide reductase heme-binding subunit YedZ [Chloroflexi bacterium]|nr:sulfoxide reductase heme-binding subunit YedZ [Chloroflexota bacterium]
MMSRLSTFWWQLVAHIGALTPLALIIWNFTQDQLTANPIRAIQLRTGRSALVLLMLSLACTPLSKVPRLRWVLKLRRLLGLYAFTYASLHLLNFIGIDYGFNLALLRKDLAEKYFIFLGLTAFICLLLLAITSTKGWQQRLGKNWQRLHWLVYLAALLVITHFFLSVKADRRAPLLYGAIVLLLLLVRLPGFLKTISRRRHQFKK